MSIYGKLVNESYTIDSIDDVKKFNKELNKWKYGVLVNGKIYIKSSEIDWANYKTIPIKDIEKYHVGICWDFVNYQHYYFKKNNIEDESYMIVMGMSDNNPNDIATHTFSIIKIDGKKYWFESSWFKNQGVHEVKSWKDVVEKFKESYDEGKNKNYDVYKYNPEGLDSHLSNGEFFNRVTKNMIYKYNNSIKENYYIANESKSNLDPNFKKKEKIYLKDLNKIKITKENTKHLSEKYKYLKHLRIENNTEGYFFTDKNDNELLIGYIMVETKENGQKWIQALEVENKFQGHRLGYQLLDFACKSLNAKYLSVNKNNKIAYRMYKNYGFKIFKETEYMYFMQL